MYYCLEVPYPSGLDFKIGLRRTDHTKLVTAVGDNQTDKKYRVDIENLEMIVQHLVLNPMLQMSIERLWTKNKRLNFTYNRLDISMHTLPGGSLSYLTPNLFEGNQIPPVFFGNNKINCINI